MYGTTDAKHSNDEYNSIYAKYPFYTPLNIVNNYKIAATIITILIIDRIRNMDKTIQYHTRDGKGNDIIKDVKIKQFPQQDIEFDCPICKRHTMTGIRIKDIVSSNFTDWAYIGDYVCHDCADLFSLYFYNYIVDLDGIRLLNIRELRAQLVTPQKPPFMFVITTSQKKHLFYRSIWNYDNSRFAVNLETETIYTTSDRMRVLFDFVEYLQTLGCSKEALKRGEIPFPVLQKVGFDTLKFLQTELSKREIQIPLYCGQKRNVITEEEAICAINLLLTA